MVSVDGRWLAADGVDAEREGAAHGDEGEEGHRGPALGLHPRRGGGDLARCRLRRCGSRSWIRQTDRWKPLPAASRARVADAPMAAAPAVTESARGMGDRSGAPARGSSGRTGTSVRGLVRRADLGRLERERAVAAVAVGRDEPGVEVLDGRLGVERDQRVLEGVGADPGDHVCRDEAEGVAHGQLAPPDLGLQLRDRQAALPVRVGEGGQPRLADEVGLGGAHGGDVELPAADHGDRDADRAGAVLLVAQPVAVPLVGQALVGDAEHLRQALADPGRLVVVVLVADRVGDDAASPRALAGPGRARSRAGTGCPSCAPPTRPTAPPRRPCRANREADPAP